MSVLQMQRISICALKKDRKAILEKIQSMGSHGNEPDCRRRGRLREDGYLECQTEI